MCCKQKAASTRPQPALQQDCKHCATTKGKPSLPAFHQLTPEKKLTACVPSAGVYQKKEAIREREREREREGARENILLIGIATVVQYARADVYDCSDSHNHSRR